MKKIFLACCISLASFSAIAGAGEYEHRFDEAKQEDDYRWTGFDDVPSNYDNNIRLGKIFGMRYNPNKSSFTDFNIYMRFSNVYRDKTYLSCDSPTWILDGTPYLDVKQKSYKDDDGSSSFTFLTRQDFENFTKASKIDYKLCGKNYSLDKYEIEGLQRVYREYAKNHL